MTCEWNDCREEAEFSVWLGWRFLCAFHVDEWLRSMERNFPLARYYKDTVARLPTSQR